MKDIPKLPDLCERHTLLKKSSAHKYLTYKQLLHITWWEFGGNFSKRIRIFYNGLKIGKSAHYAYLDAKSYIKT